MAPARGARSRQVKPMVYAMAEGNMMIMENTRFYKGETKNDPE